MLCHHVLRACVHAGYTSLVEQAQLERIAAAGADTSGLLAWAEFQAGLQAGSISFPSPHAPFLFAGEGEEESLHWPTAATR